MGKFVIKKTNTGYNFNLKANNGETIATSEVYTTLDAARNGVASVAKNAPIANLEDQTLADFEVAKHPKFEIYKDKSEQFRFRLKGVDNGCYEVLVRSDGEKYQFRNVFATRELALAEILSYACIGDESMEEEEGVW